MGLFDTFVVPERLTCPNGHFNSDMYESETDFQTKALENLMSTYRLGDQLLSSAGWPIKIDAATVWTYSWCHICSRVYGIDVFIRDGKFDSYSSVRWEHDEG